MNTLYSAAFRAQKNEALRLVRQYLTYFPNTTISRNDLEKAAIRRVKQENMRHGYHEQRPCSGHS
jgi:hypothetical protein